jgi:hypothetical protein
MQINYFSVERINYFREGQNFPLKFPEALCYILINNIDDILFEAGCKDFGNFRSHGLSYWYQTNLMPTCPRISTLWHTLEKLFSYTQFNRGTK